MLVFLFWWNTIPIWDLNCHNKRPKSWQCFLSWSHQIGLRNIFSFSKSLFLTNIIWKGKTKTVCNTIRWIILSYLRVMDVNFASGWVLLLNVTSFGFYGGCSWHWVHLIVGRDAETFAGIIGKDPLCHQNVQLHIYGGKKTGKSRTSRSRCQKQGNLENLWADVFEGHHRALLPCSLSSGWDGLQNVHICNPGTTNFSFTLTKIKFFCDMR